VLTAEADMGIAQIRLEDLSEIATWIDCWPAHGSFGETFYEMSFAGGHFLTSRYLRHVESRRSSGDR
jgi:hypothetical protein